jgi:hypothetical protein
MAQIDRTTNLGSVSGSRCDTLADALGGLVTLVRELGLTVGQATACGLLDWDTIAAA